MNNATTAIPEIKPELPEPLQEKMDREQLLQVSTHLIQDLHARLRVQRFRSRKHDSTRLAYARALVGALQAHASILRDAELDDLKDRLQVLEQRRNRGRP